MEESEKRRERLRAMRMEAAEAEVCDNVHAPAFPSGLSNPLIETSATTPESVEFHSAPRFDFYTDPMAAFSSNKRRSNVGSQIVSHNPAPSNYGGSPTSQLSSNLPGQRVYQARGFSYNSGPNGNPMGMTNQFPLHQGTTHVLNGFGIAAQHYYPIDPARGCVFPNPGFGPTGSTAQGRAQWFGHSPSPSSGYGGSPGPSPSPGRGRGHWPGSNMSPSSGWASGRGSGSHSHPSGGNKTAGLGRFYDESMIEDPWKFLKPVIWKTVNTTSYNLNGSNSSMSWTQLGSLGSKRPRASETSSKSGSQPSLAEYLAASFNEAVNETSNK